MELTEVSTVEEWERCLARFPSAVRNLILCGFCIGSTCNGGFHCYLATDAGNMAPETVSSFRAIGARRTADLLDEVISFFGAPFPRDSDAREQLLMADSAPEFERQDAEFYELMDDPLQDSKSLDEIMDEYAYAHVKWGEYSPNQEDH